MTSRFSGRALALVLAVAGLPGIGCAVAAERTHKFTFGTAARAAGATVVPVDAAYTKDAGFGFEGTARPRAGRSAAIGDEPFFFSVALPEGNYRVTVTLGDAAGGEASTTTVKAELRRLMLEQVFTAAGQNVERTFIVNLRRPEIAAANGVAAGVVRLKAPRETTQEAWAWDDRLTLEFNGTRPAVSAIAIEPADEVPTVFLIGDSTVCDQSREPFASWGQMFTAFFKPEVAIANHGESGETYRDSIGRRRLDKMISAMKPGDVLIMQFGHNDQKQRGEGMGPFLNYKDEIKQHVAAARAVGGVPIVVSPMERRNFDEQGRLRASLSDYAEGARQAAVEAGVAFVDLNAMSISLYEALGPEQSVAAFAVNDGRVDNTHHNNYGAYQIAKCVVEGLRRANLPITKFVREDLPRYDPGKPDSVESFAVPASPLVTNITPLGN